MTVYLVGAGPGDPGLMTARALELIAAADVIVYDRLIPAGALDGARPDAQLIYAGKEGGGPSVSQAEIERAAARARQPPGATVVRLKGGDPFVFGRGGEEAELLRAAGIDVRGRARASPPAWRRRPTPGSRSPTATRPARWRSSPATRIRPSPSRRSTGPRWPRFPGTLVVYMGVRRLEAIAAAPDRRGPAGLRARGGDRARARCPDQRVVTGTLETIAAVAEQNGIRAPAMSLFGPVAALRHGLAWFEARPLAGRTVAVTRARAQASGLAGAAARRSAPR